MKKIKIAIVLLLVLVLGAVSLAGATGLIEKFNADIGRDFTIRSDGDAKILKKAKNYNSQKYDETKFIGQDKAKDIALKKAGLKETEVSFVKTELDHERGVPVYEVEFNHGYIEYGAEINANDGTILEWDVDFDD